MRYLASRTAPILAIALLLTACGAPTPTPTSGTAGTAESTPGASATPATPSPATAGPTATTEPAARLTEHAVAAAHPAAVEAGMDILAEGGNAADAAVATAFAIAVVEPYASGIGGGGSALLAAPGEEPVGYDYREVVAQDGRIPDSGTGIPGFVAGLAEIHAEHGDLDWDELLEPAIGLAEDGFPVTEFLAQRIRSDFGPASLVGLDHFAKAFGQPLAVGDRLVQQDLAETMTTLAAEGPESFYTGSLAEELTRVDGLDAASLAAYEPERADPVSGSFGDYEVLSAAPPLPGAALVQQLQLVEALGIADHRPGTAGYVERLSEAWTVADASVTGHLGDPDFVDVPVERLTDAGHNAQLAERLSVPAGDAGIGRAGGQPVTAGNTTHLTVVDADGFTVSMTNTLTNFWGGRESEYVGGFFLNNQLSRFEAIPTANNRPAPGRKSVSWSAPTLVLDAEGRPVLGLGSPGGHQIPNILTGVLVAWGLQGSTLQEAVDAPRFHLQDGVLAVEQDPAELSALITARGWELQRTQREDAIFGSVQALQIDYGTGTITGARDSRREADVAIADAGADTGAGAE